MHQSLATGSYLPRRDAQAFTARSAIRASGERQIKKVVRVLPGYGRSYLISCAQGQRVTLWQPPSAALRFATARHRQNCAVANIANIVPSATKAVRAAPLRPRRRRTPSPTQRAGDAPYRRSSRAQLGAPLGVIPMAFTRVLLGLAGAMSLAGASVSSNCRQYKLPWSKTLQPSLQGESSAAFYLVTGDLLLGVTGHHRPVTELVKGPTPVSTTRLTSSAAPAVTIFLPVAPGDIDGHTVDAAAAACANASAACPPALSLARPPARPLTIHLQCPRTSSAHARIGRVRTLHVRRHPMQHRQPRAACIPWEGDLAPRAAATPANLEAEHRQQNDQLHHQNVQGRGAYGPA